MRNTKRKTKRRKKTFVQMNKRISVRLPEEAVSLRWRPTLFDSALKIHVSDNGN